MSELDDDYVSDDATMMYFDGRPPEIIMIPESVAKNVKRTPLRLQYVDKETGAPHTLDCLPLGFEIDGEAVRDWRVLRFLRDMARSAT